MLNQVHPQLGGPGPFQVLPLILEPDPARTVAAAVRFCLPGRLCRRSRRTAGLSWPGGSWTSMRPSRTALWAGCSKRCTNGTATWRRCSCAATTSLATKSADSPPMMRKSCCSAPISARNSPSRSAALFNPSIVFALRDEDEDGDSRFVLSLRGVGEGHISSVTFRTGSWSADGGSPSIPQPYAVPPRIIREMEGSGAELICDGSADVSGNGDLPHPSQPKPRRRGSAPGAIHRG